MAYETAQPRVDLREQGKQVAKYCFTPFPKSLFYSIISKKAGMYAF